MIQVKLLLQRILESIVQTRKTLLSLTVISFIISIASILYFDLYKGQETERQIEKIVQSTSNTPSEIKRLRGEIQRLSEAQITKADLVEFGLSLNDLKGASTESVQLLERALVSLGEYKPSQAITYFELLEPKVPTAELPQFYRSKALAWMMLFDSKNALAEFNKAIALDKSDLISQVLALQIEHDLNTYQRNKHEWEVAGLDIFYKVMDKLDDPNLSTTSRNLHTFILANSANFLARIIQDNHALAIEISKLGEAVAKSLNSPLLLFTARALSANLSGEHGRWNANDIQKLISNMNFEGDWFFKKGLKLNSIQHSDDHSQKISLANDLIFNCGQHARKPFHYKIDSIDETYGLFFSDDFLLRVACDSNRPKFFIARGDAKLAIGEYSPARMDFAQALNVCNRKRNASCEMQAYLGLGESYVGLGKKNLAVESFKAGLEVSSAAREMKIDSEIRLFEQIFWQLVSVSADLEEPNHYSPYLKDIDIWLNTRRGAEISIGYLAIAKMFAIVGNRPVNDWSAKETAVLRQILESVNSQALLEDDILKSQIEEWKTLVESVERL